MSPGAAAPAGTETPPPPTAAAPVARSPHPTAQRLATVHTKTRARASPRVAPGPSPPPSDPAAPLASRAAWQESPAAVEDQSAHSDPLAPGAALTPAPSWLTPPQTTVPHRSWPRSARPPRMAAPFHGPPDWSSGWLGAAASAAASPG